MKRIIQEKLAKIEKEEQVQIILAVESGSRAWGFESSDSDYDVRFLYVRKKDQYLKLEGIRDVIEWQLDDVLDINGWDIQKAFKLLYKSNPTMFEWCVSPIKYKETKESQQLEKIVPHYLSNKKILFHYWHMANSNYREYLKQEQVRAKKYFYVLRPILAGKWIVTHQSVPPIVFEELADGLLDNSIKPIVKELLIKKKETNELDVMNKIEPLNQYIETELLELEQQAKDAMENKHNSWQELNDLFLSFLHE